MLRKCSGTIVKQLTWACYFDKLNFERILSYSESAEGQTTNVVTPMVTADY